MSEQENYLEYVLMFSLSILTVSASYFVDISNPVSFSALLMIPIVFGYTTYASRDGFQKASLASLVGVFFLPIGFVTAAVGILVAIGNPLVSVFAGGGRFHDFFRAVSMPLLICAIIISGTGYYVASTNPEIKNQMRDQGAQIIGQTTESFIEQTGFIDQYQDTQIQVMRTTSEASVQLTQYYVLNQTRDDLDPQELQTVANAFGAAQTEVPTMIEEQTNQQVNNTQVDYSEAVSGAVKRNFNDKFLLALIPTGTMLIYSLNPLIGLLNALFASIFKALDRRFEVF